MNRYTFVVHAYPGGASMLENLSTHERIRISDLAAVGPQIESWLADLHKLKDGPSDTNQDKKSHTCKPRRVSVSVTPNED